MTNLIVYLYRVTRKIAQYLGEVLDDQRDKLQENLLANGGNVSKLSLVMRKPVFRVSDQVRHKPGCTATEDG